MAQLLWSNQFNASTGDDSVVFPLFSIFKKKMKRAQKLHGRESRDDKGHILADPYSRKIAELFIYPIMDACPSGVELAKWVEVVFGAGERWVCKYRVKREFVIPGFFKECPEVFQLGWEDGKTRLIKSRTKLWVRFDDKYPNAIDVEPWMYVGRPAFAADGGPRERERVFRLTQLQWKQIRGHLEPLDPEGA